jgi:fatty acid desaturase
MSWREWWNPSTRWEDMSPRELRRSGVVWTVWFLLSSAYWIGLGRLMFHTTFIPDDNALLLVSWIAAMVLAIVSFFWALARFVGFFLLK